MILSGWTLFSILHITSERPCIGYWDGGGTNPTSVALKSRCCGRESAEYDNHVISYSSFSLSDYNQVTSPCGGRAEIAHSIDSHPPVLNLMHGPRQPYIHPTV